MKNIISIIMAALVGVFAFSSCEKEVTSEPLATISISVNGKVFADLNLKNTEMESVPDGTKIIFRIDSEDLVQDPIDNYSYETLQYETTVTGGKYTIQLPAVKFAGVNVNITPVDFVANQTQPDDSFKEKVYHGVVNSVTIREGEIVYQDLTYATY